LLVTLLAQLMLKAVFVQLTLAFNKSAKSFALV
jgi:hypothetical protein